MSQTDMNLWSIFAGLLDILDFVQWLFDWRVNWRQNIAILAGIGFAGLALTQIPNAFLSYIVAGLLLIAGTVLGFRWNHS